jgi:hypothetical protein
VHFQRIFCHELCKKYENGKSRGDSALFMQMFVLGKHPQAECKSSRIGELQLTGCSNLVQAL